MEIANVITAANLALNKNSQSQMLAAIQSLTSTAISTAIAAIPTPTIPVIPHGMQVFSTPGTFTFYVPTGVTKVTVEICGGGGGGGGTTQAGAAASGGAGGAYCLGMFNVAPSQAITVQIGAGGSAGIGPSNGKIGGTTSFGIGPATICFATGGYPGYSSSGGGQTTVGTGGLPSGGTISVRGQTGFAGQVLGGTGLGGQGAPPYFFPNATPSTGAGSNSAPGGGGGGGANGGNGGAGGSGHCLVTW